MQNKNDKIAAIADAITDAADWLTRNDTADSVAECTWPGQSDDGRKHDTRKEKAFPWDGASDTRIRLAEEIIDDNARLLKAAYASSNIGAKPVNTATVAQAQAVTVFLEWLRDTCLTDEKLTEIPLLAQWRELYGAAVLGIAWRTETKASKQELTIDQLDQLRAQVMQSMQAAEENDPEAFKIIGGVNTLFEAIATPPLAPDGIAVVQDMYPHLTPAKAKRIFEHLRDYGKADVPYREVIASRPEWTALRVMRDIFFPVNTCKLQDAEWLAQRETLTKAQLSARVEDEDYSPSAVADALEKAVGTSLATAATRDSYGPVDEMKDLVEIFHHYERRDGTVHVTVLCPATDATLTSYTLDYAHGGYPFVEFVRARKKRPIIENKGVAEIVDTWQKEVKAHRDGRVDRLSASIFPPLLVPQNRPNLDINFGPGATIKERKPGEISFLRIPALDQDTVGIERETRADASNYFCRPAPGVSDVRQALFSQEMASEWLESLKLVVNQTLALARQHMGDEAFHAVTGVQMDFAAGALDFTITLEFNASMFNVELVMKKLNLVKEILNMDTFGIVDRAGLVRWAMESVDPRLARDIVQDAQDASAAEVEDETAQFAKLFAGVEPEMKPGGQNYGLRLQTLQKILQSNPNLEQRMQSDPVFAAMIQNRMKHFNFMLTQQQNAQIGRVGAQPVLGNN